MVLLGIPRLYAPLYVHATKLVSLTVGLLLVPGFVARSAWTSALGDMCGGGTRPSSGPAPGHLLHHQGQYATDDDRRNVDHELQGRADGLLADTIGKRDRGVRRRR